MITMSKRLNIIKGYKDDTPGPGSYLHFSEFGMWVPKNYSKTIRASQRMNTENKTDGTTKWFG